MSRFLMISSTAQSGSEARKFRNLSDFTKFCAILLLLKSSFNSRRDQKRHMSKDEIFPQWKAFRENRPMDDRAHSGSFATSYFVIIFTLLDSVFSREFSNCGHLKEL